MKASSGSRLLVLVRAMAAALALFVGVEAVAFDYAMLSRADEAVMACMESELDADTMELVHKGERPESRSLRKRIRRAYEACLSRLGTMEKGIESYDGPLFDAMSQIDETVDMDKSIERVRQAGVDKLALFARSKKRLGQNEQAVLDLARRNSDLIVLGAPKYFQLSGDLDERYIRYTEAGIRKHDYRFVGEILYTHGDKGSGKQYASGERYVDPTKPGTSRFLKAIAPLKIPVMTHFEPYAVERDFPRFHELYATWPAQTFLLPHMGFCSPEQVDEFLGRHPNLYALMSKKERLMTDFSDPGKAGAIGSAMLDGVRLRPEWKAILVKYQDRVLFATDPHMKKLWRMYGSVVDKHRLILGQLPREVAEKIAYRNAEKVYGVTVGSKK